MTKQLIEPVLEGPRQEREPATSILLVDGNPGDARLIQESLAAQSVAKFSVVHVGSLGEAFVRLSRGHFDAVLIDLSLPDAQGPDTLRRLRRRAPSVPAVVITDLSDEAMAVKVMREGAQDYLVKGEMDGSALAHRLCFAIERHLASLAHSLPEEQPKQCKTLGLIGSKGGVGASTIACYLGMALHNRTKETVLLADFDFEAGVLGFLMEADPKYSLRDALQNADRLDTSLWNSLVCSKKPGLDIITAPNSVIPKEEATPEQFRQVLSFLRSSYQWIIADLGRGFNKHLTSLLEDADGLCVVTTLELAALRRARMLIQKVKQPEWQLDSLRLVLNDLPKRSPFSPPDIERMLGCPVWATIPHVPELREIQERSMSLPQTGALVKAVAKMAEEISGVPKEKPKDG